MRRTPRSFGYIFCCLWSLWSISAQGQSEDQLPAFSFANPQGAIVSDDTFRNDRPLIVFYYEPSCSHCQQQAQWVSDRMEDFRQVDLLWVAWEATDGVPAFHDQYFTGYDNVHHAIDTETKFDDLFGFSRIPTVFVYNRGNNLIKKFKKETRAEKLLNTLDLP